MELAPEVEPDVREEAAVVDQETLPGERLAEQRRGGDRRPTTVFAGQFPAFEVRGRAPVAEQVVRVFGARSGGTKTWALINPASSLSWSIDVIAVVWPP